MIPLPSADVWPLLRVELVTGRTHQIRAHLASIGCPILGDSKYGNNAANRELKLKYQALCAWELAFPKKDQRPTVCRFGWQGVPRTQAMVLPAGTGWNAEISVMRQGIDFSHPACFYCFMIAALQI